MPSKSKPPAASTVPFTQVVTCLSCKGIHFLAAQSYYGNTEPVPAPTKVLKCLTCGTTHRLMYGHNGAQLEQLSLQ